MINPPSTDFGHTHIIRRYDDAIWDASMFSKNRERLLEGDGAHALFDRVLGQDRGSSHCCRMNTAQWTAR